ncbi:hypothetical protein HDF16_005939 [Granulicella aggregans]|uniref:Uncharacterized protein n=1 Tax=Granulicella aggregans TaxID=474949 RepID=A0A7W8E6H2_9BACT|nr:hypothetical protein [Granulicella aggregans]MBB5061203.1 hypothetical protein [Granulicella aggregans]
MLNIAEIENTLWLGSFIGHIALLIVLTFRRCVTEFPVFTTRISYLTATTIALFYISRYGTAHDYFRAYWAVAFIDYALQVGVIYEMARHVLRSRGKWISEARRPFLIWSAVGSAIAVAIGAAIRIPGETGLSLYSIQSNFATSFLTCGVFLAMSLSADRLALQWTNHDMAIGEGLTFWNLCTLIEQIAHLATGWNPNQRAYDDVSSAAYVLSLLFWIVAFSLPVSKRPPLSRDVQEQLALIHEHTIAGLKTLDSAATPTKRDEKETQ